jgi:hypothetical protein
MVILDGFIYLINDTDKLLYRYTIDGALVTSFNVECLNGGRLDTLASIVVDGNLLHHYR